MIMEIVRQLIHENVPGVREEFKWSRPVFSKKKGFAYLKTAKEYVTLGFPIFINWMTPLICLREPAKTCVISNLDRSIPLTRIF